MNKEVKQGKANDDYATFTGTDHYYKWLGNIILTDGTMQMAQDCQSYWLLDIICSYQSDKSISSQFMQVWKMKRDDIGEGCTVWCEDGNDNKLIEQYVEYTDFPYNEAEMWLMNKVILLPSEY